MKKVIIFLSIITCYFTGYNLNAQTTGDYRTTAATTMLTTTGWQTYNGSSWVAPTYAPAGNALNVTQPTTTANGSTSATLSASNSYIRAGQYVTGTGIATGSTVASVSGSSLTLSLAATANATNTLTFAETFSATGSASNGSTAVTLTSSNAAIAVGMAISGTGIATGTTVSAISGTTLTLSVATTSAISSATLTFNTTQTTASFSNASYTITLASSNSLLANNMLVYGTSIPLGTYITNVSGTTVTLSMPTTNSNTGTGLTFGYLIIPNLYINHTVSTGYTSSRAASILKMVINDQNQSNPGTAGLTLTSPGSFYVGAAGSGGGGGMDIECGSVSVAPLSTLGTANNTTAYAYTMEIFGGAGGNALSVSNGGTVDFTTATGNASVTNVTFTTAGSTTIASTTKTLKFNTLSVNMGGSLSNTLNMQAVFSVVAASSSQTLTVTSGTLNITSASNITPFGSSTAVVTASSSAGLTLNNGSLVINAVASASTGGTSTVYTNNGSFTLTNGTVNMGAYNNAGADGLVQFQTNGAFVQSGGTFNVYGAFNNNSSGSATISGGTLNIPIGGALNQASMACFKSGGTSYAQSGGNINIYSHNSNASGYNDYYVTSPTTTITGGTVTFGGASALQTQGSATFYNLVVGDGTNVSTFSPGGQFTILNQLTVNTNGTWSNNTNNYAMAIQGGGITNNGTFNAGTGTYTFNTSAAQSLNSSVALVIPSLTVNSPTVLTNNGTLTVGTALTGSGNLAQSNNSVLNIGGTSTITTLTASANGNTVNYTSNGNQTINGASTYYHLNLLGTGTKTLQNGTTTISGNLTLSGTVSTATAVGLAIGGNLIVGDGTNAAGFTAGAYSLTVSGSTTVANASTLTISSSTGAKQFNGLVTINNGGTWNNSSNSAITIGSGGITNSSTGTFTSGSGVYTFNTASAQALTGTLAIQSINIASPTVLTNNGVLTVSSSLVGTGSLTQAAGATLNYGGSGVISPTLTATATNNTVNYNGGGTTVNSTAYYNLILSGSGNKYLQSVSAIANNLLVQGTSVTGNNGSALSIGGNLTIGDGTNASSFTVYGFNFTVSGTTTVANASTLTFNSSTGTKQFNGLVKINNGGTWNNNGSSSITLSAGINNAGTLTAGNGTYTLTGGNFSSTGNFTPNSGTFVFTGASQQISSATFYSLTINQPSPTPSTSTNLLGNVVVSNKLFLTNGNLVTGVGDTISVAAISGGGANSFIDGSVVLTNLASNTNYTLPVGSNTSSKYMPLAINLGTLPSGSNTLGVTNYNTSTNSPQLGISPNEYWTVVATNSNSTPFALSSLTLTAADLGFYDNISSGTTLTGSGYSVIGGSLSSTSTSLTLSSPTTVLASGTPNYFVFSGSSTGVYYWVGGSAANWASSSSWSTASGGTPLTGGIYPNYLDSIVFDANSNNPTVALTANTVIRGVTINGANLSFTLSGAYNFVDTNLNINGAASQAILNNQGGNVTIGKSINFGGVGDSIVFAHSTNSENLFLGNGSTAQPFFILNSTNGAFGFGQYSTTGSACKIIAQYATSSVDTIYFNGNTPSIWGLGVTSGTLVLGSSIKVSILSLGATNNQILRVPAGVTLSLANNNTSSYTSAAGGGLIDATAGNIIISSFHPSVLNNAANMFLNSQVYNLTLNTSSFYTFMPFQALTITNNLYLQSGTYNNSTNNITFASGASLTRGNGALTASPNYGTGNALNVTYSNTSTISSNEYELVPNTGSVGNVTLNGSSTVTLSTNATITGNLVVNTGNTFNLSSDTVNLAGSFTNNGTFVPSGGTFNYNGGNQTVTAVTYFNLMLTGGGVKTLTPSTVINGNATIQGTTSVTMVENMTIGNSLTVGDGTNSAYFNTAGFSLAVGKTTVNNAGTLNLNNNAATYSFGLVTVNNGGTWNNSANSPVTYTGGITNNGTYNAGSGVQTFTSNSQSLNGVLSIPTVVVTGITLNNLAVATVANSISGTGKWNQGATGTVNIGGSLTIATFSASTTGNTVNFNGSSDQFVPALIYYNLSLTGAYAGSGNLTLASSGTIGIANNLIYTATFTSGSLVIAGSTISYIGSSPQTMPANLSTYNNLTINQPTPSTVALSGNVAVNGILTLVSGYVVTGGYTIGTPIVSGGSINTFVDGNLALSSFSNNTTYSFPVGSSSAIKYMPVTINPGTLPTGTNTIKVAVKNGATGSPQAGLSNSEYWTITAANSNATPFTFSNLSLTASDLNGFDNISSSTLLGGTNYSVIGDTVSKPIIYSLSDKSPYLVFNSGTPNYLVFSGSSTGVYYWVGRPAGNWSSSSSWSTTSGGTPLSGGIYPNALDSAVFDPNSGNPTATLTANTSIRGIAINGDSLSFTLAGGFNLIDTNLNINGVGSQAIFNNLGGNVTIETSINFGGAGDSIVFAHTSNSEILYLGDGNTTHPFYIYNSSNGAFGFGQYSSGGASGRIVAQYAKTTTDTIYFNSNAPFIWGIGVTSGTLVLGSSIQVATVALNSTNNQILKVLRGTTLNLGANNTSNYSISTNGGRIDASEGNIYISGYSPTLLNNSAYMFLNNKVYNLALIIGSGYTFVPFQPLTVTGNLTLASGTFNNSTNNITIASNATVKRSGGALTAPPLYADNTIDVSYTNTSPISANEYELTPASGNVRNLTINGTSSVTLANNVTVTGNLAINVGNTFNLSNNTVFIAGSLTNNGVFAPATGTVNFNGTTAQTVPALNYYNLSMTGNYTGANNLTLASSGIIGVSNALSYSPTFASGTLVTTGSTVSYNGASAQNIAVLSSPYNNLTINQNPSSTATLTGNVTATGTLTLTKGNVITGSPYTITAGVISGGSSSSFVDGNLAISPISSNSTYTYPVGSNTASKYMPMSIVSGSLPSGTSTIQVAVNNSSTGSPQVGLSPNEYWTIQATNTNSSSVPIKAVAPTASDLNFFDNISSSTSLTGTNYLAIGGSIAKPSSTTLSLTGLTLSLANNAPNYFLFSGSYFGAYYWVGGSTGNWSAANNWSVSSGGTPLTGGVYPNFLDSVIFDGNSSSPTVTLTANTIVRGILIDGSNQSLSLAGAYNMSDTNLNINGASSQISFGNTGSSTIAKSINFGAAGDSILFPQTNNTSTLYLGDGNTTHPFYITNTTNGAFGFGQYSSGSSGIIMAQYATTTTDTIYFNSNTPTIGGIGVSSGNLVLGSSLNASSVFLNSANGQMLRVPTGVTLNLGGTKSNQSMYTSATNGGLIDATGGNIIISGLSPTLLSNYANMFYTSKIYNLTLNIGSGNIFNPNQKLTITNGLTLTSGIYNNVTNNITLGAGAAVTINGANATLSAAPIYQTSGTAINIQTNASSTAGNELQPSSGKVGALTFSPSASATYTLAAGVKSLSINGGNGYSNTFTPLVTFSAPPSGGTTATGTAYVNPSGVVSSIAITNPGSGYTSAPTVYVAPPTAQSWTATTAYLLNTIVVNGPNYYICSQAGTSGSSGGPTGTTLSSQITTDGTAFWYYIGSWSPNTAYSTLNTTYIINNNSVYRLTTAGTSASSGGPNGNASGISDNTAKWNYVCGFTAAWQANAAYSVGNVVTNGGNIYICTVAGSSSNTGGPSGTSSGITDNTATWNYLSSSAVSAATATATISNAISVASLTLTGGSATVSPTISYPNSPTPLTFTVSGNVSLGSYTSMTVGTQSANVTHLMIIGGNLTGANTTNYPVFNMFFGSGKIANVTFNGGVSQPQTVSGNFSTLAFNSIFLSGSGTNITFNAAPTINGSTTIAANTTLQSGVTYPSNISNSGTVQVNTSGSYTGNITYNANSTASFNNSAYIIGSSDKMWPSGTTIPNVLVLANVGCNDATANSNRSVTGTMNVQAAVTLSNTATNTLTIGAAGTMKMNTGGSFVSSTNKPLYTSGALLEYAANMAIGNEWNNASKVQIDNTVTLTGTPSGTYSLTGNFTNNGTYTSSGETINFNGSSAQSINGNATTFNVVNFSGAGGVTLNTPVTASSSALSNGSILTTTATNILSIVNNAVNSLSGNSSSYINGPVKWTMNTATGTYNFPVGASGNYYNFALINPNTGGSTVTITLQSFASGNPSSSYNASTLTGVGAGYWSFTSTTALASLGGVVLTSPSVLLNPTAVVAFTNGANVYQNGGQTITSNTLTSNPSTLNASTITPYAAQLYALGTPTPTTDSTTYGTAGLFTVSSNNGTTYSATGLVTGMSINAATGAITVAPTTAAGIYNINLTATNGGNTTSATLVYTVKKATLTITAGNQTVTYGTDTSTVKGNGTYTVSGLKNGENTSVIGGQATYTTTYLPTSGAGTVGLTITPVVSGLTANNYAFTPANGSITVTKAPLSLSANNQTVCFGTATSTVIANGSYTATGFVNGETVAVFTGTASYSTNYTATTAAGSAGVTITLSGLSSSNYSFVPSAGTITINAITTISISSQPATTAQYVCLNSTPSTLTVAATGTNLTYQWYANNTNLNSGGTLVPGATSANYTPPTTSVGSQYYYCQLSGQCASLSSNVSGGYTTMPDGSWAGTTNTWSTPTNWCGGLPTASTNVIINAAFVAPTISGMVAATVNNLTIGNGASLTVTGTLQIAGAIGNSGTLDATAATIQLNGSFAQTLPAAFSSSNTVSTLIVSNPAGVTLGGNLNITGYLHVTSGTLNLSNYNITLKSTPTATGQLGTISGSIQYGGTGRFVSETYINTSRRGYRNIGSGGILSDSSIFANWQENGSTAPGYGTQITGSVGYKVGYNPTTGLDYTITGNPSLFTYNTNDAFVKVVNTIVPTTGALVPFVGYYAVIRGDRTYDLLTLGPNLNIANTTLRVKGKATTGTVTLSSNANPVCTIDGSSLNSSFRLNANAAPTGKSPSDYGYSLVANPYPCIINWASVYARSSGASYSNGHISPYYWVWNQATNSNAGTWVTVSNNGIANTTPASTLNYNTQYIQPGQSFFVQNDNTGNNMVVEFQESDKYVADAAQVKKNFSTQPVPDHLRISLIRNDSTGAVTTDGAVATFDASYNNGIDVFDAAKFANNTENIAIQRGANQLSIESKKTPAPLDSIPLTVWNLTSGSTYSLQVSTANYATGPLPYLFDAYLATYTPLPKDTVVTYSFVFSTDTNTYKHRFSIRFSNPTILPLSFLHVTAKPLSGENRIDWEMGNVSDNTVFSIQRSVDGTNFNGIGSIKASNVLAYNFTDRTPLGGVGYYRIIAQTPGQQSVYSSVVSVSATSSPFVTLLGNVIENRTILMAINNLPKGNYQVVLYSSDGKAVAVQTLLYNGINGTVKTTLDENVHSEGIYWLQLRNDKQVYLNEKVLLR